MGVVGVRSFIIIPRSRRADDSSIIFISIIVFLEGGFMNRLLRAYVTLLVLLAANLCRADVFGSGTNSFEIEFVTIGQSGNPADTTGDPNPAGAVPYGYRIGKYEVPEDAVRKANAQSALDGQPLGVTLDTRGPKKPATSLSWFEVAKFVNWLNTNSGATPAYKFVDVIGPRGGVIGTTFALWEPGDAGYDPANRFRNRLAAYVLPSADEWYKAAFYDPASGTYFDYPTGSNIPPVPVASGTAPGTAVVMQGLAAGPADIAHAGGLSPYGTMAQGGNAWEWEETELDLLNDNSAAYRGGRGGGWDSFPSNLSATIRNGGLPGTPPTGAGFRVANVIPEPGTALLLWTTAPVLIRVRRRR